MRLFSLRNPETLPGAGAFVHAEKCVWLWRGGRGGCRHVKGTECHE